MLEETCNLERLFETFRKKKVLGMMRPEELQTLFLYALTNHLPGPVVEIGSWAGLSTIVLAKATRLSDPKRRVIAIDHFKGNVEHQEMLQGRTLAPMFQRNIQLMAVADQIDLLAMSSEEALSHVEDNISLLFVDGEHLYEEIRKDIANYAPLVAVQGSLLFHDYRPEFGTMRAVDEWLEQDRRFQKVAILQSVLVVKRVT